MTVLQALSGYYDRLAALGEAPPIGFSQENISWAIVLSPEGAAVDVMDLQVTADKKPRPRAMQVPAAVKRGRSIAPNLLWDKSAYVLGVAGKTGDRLASKHAAFKTLHADLLVASNDAGLIALARFLAGWSPDRFDAAPFREEMRDANIVFRLDGELPFLHDRSAARDLVARRAASGGGIEGFCLVTGERAPIARLHPLIKGVQGTHSVGASIVSFGRAAFRSQGKEQGLNAPVSERATFAYSTALNRLLARGSRNRARIGDATTVFWAEAGADREDSAAMAETLFRDVLSPGVVEAAKLRGALDRLAAGRPFAEVAADLGLDPETRFHVLGLAPNVSRLSIRFWHTDTIGALFEKLQRHWRDMRIEPVRWARPPSAWHLLLETARQRDGKNIPPLLGGALMRAILTGGPYPRALLSAVITRIRADGDVNDTRAAILKACILRGPGHGNTDQTQTWADRYVSLDLKEANAGYRLGRLFAVLEGAQGSALGNVNARIRNRYFGAASATPASTFPVLFRNTKNHLKVIRTRRGGGLAHWYDKEIGEIVDGFETTDFPRNLSMTDQGRFAIGYYHEREALYRRRKRDLPAADQTDENTHDEEEES